MILPTSTSAGTLDPLAAPDPTQYQAAVFARNLEVPPNPKGLVVICHSDAGARRKPRTHYLAQCLAVKGLAVLHVDLLAARDEEAGMPWRFPKNLQLMAERITAAVQWVRKQPGLRQISVGCLGIGAGGTAALMAAAALTAAIDVLVVADGQPEFAGDGLSNILAATLLIVSGNEDIRRRMNEIVYARLNCNKELTILSRKLDEFDGQEFEKIGIFAAGWFQRHLAPADKFVARAGQPQST